MSNREKVEKGLECCQVSMGDDEPFGKCGVCPYRDDGIDVEDCRAVLCRETSEVIKKMAETIAQIMTRLTDEELIEMLPYIRDENVDKVSLIELKHILREAIK